MLPDPPAGSQLVPVRAQSIPDELSVGIGGDLAERRGFYYFQSYVWPQLSSKLSSVFWERLILQASHADSAIRHASIAFGSLGERLLINDVMTFDNKDANSLHNFACSHYYKAVKELRKKLSSDQERSVEFTLIACFIFVCFEFLQGNEGAALTHLQSGIEIIRRSNFPGTQYDPSNPAVPLIEPADFGYHAAVVFTIIDRSAANWVAGTSFGMPAPIVNALEYRSLLAEGFPNIKTADIYLINLSRQLHRVLSTQASAPGDTTTPPNPLLIRVPLFNELSITIDNWSRAMDMFMARSGHNFSAHEFQRATTLILRHRVAALRLAASCQMSEENFYRDSEPDFNYIFSLSIPLLRPIDDTIEYRGSDNERNRGLFSFHDSIVSPLYFIAIHCQHSEVQNRALTLLSESPWREGAWDSAVMARIAERKIRQRQQILSFKKIQPIDHASVGSAIMGHNIQRHHDHTQDIPKFRLLDNQT